jgi:hypothetical protein
MPNTLPLPARRNPHGVLTLLLVTLLITTATGCAHQATPPLYQWEHYQPQVHQYLTGDKTSPQEQLQTLQTDLQKIQTSGGKVPPGYYAHLGLLYGEQGDLLQFAQHLELEKKTFPESAGFMNFLMRNFRKPK